MSLSCKVHVKNSLYIFTEVNGAIFIKSKTAAFRIKSKTAAFRGVVHNHALYASAALLQKNGGGCLPGSC